MSVDFKPTGDPVKYKIIGSRPVAGADPGKTVELDLPEANIAALVAAGHIAAVKSSVKSEAPGKAFAKPVEPRKPADVNGAAEDPREAR